MYIKRFSDFSFHLVSTFTSPSVKLQSFLNSSPEGPDIGSIKRPLPAETGGLSVHISSIQKEKGRAGKMRYEEKGGKALDAEGSPQQSAVAQ